ncbi:hypothetical protein K2173_015134 [Erythroxylum novogranatense]|uniref:Response regulatory domain-containing protein n=1 Tax=Erythroxylum novogranatense TaxID=1862640 RepID=A0AAV8T135_9ROSI|nr:hypothetical protein K2173_015134 [Erythroxylum novogranatense]
MVALQRVSSSVSMTAGSYGSPKDGDFVISDQFPAGLRVLVIDEDITCLRIIEKMLRRLHYQALKFSFCLFLSMFAITSCSQATVALNLIRVRKECFDVVLSDVHMPDMDGFKLLECVGLEMDLPVIMMSVDGRTSAVMRGIRHRACDYLIKPIRDEELKNIWQHVIRKKWTANKDLEHSVSLENYDWFRQRNDDADYACSVYEGANEALKGPEKRSNTREEDDGEVENDDPTTTKKPRVVCSVELHQQFVSAVNQLGIDKAVPKRILELMNVPGVGKFWCEHHIPTKFRLYLKRLSGIAQPAGISNAFSLAASDQIHPQTLVALHAKLLGCSTSSLVTASDRSALIQPSIQLNQSTSVEHGALSQPLVKCESNSSKHFQQNMASTREVASGFGSWPANNLGALGLNSNIQQQPQQSLLPEPSCPVNVEPSYLVIPSQSLASSSPSLNQNCSNKGVPVNCSLLLHQLNHSLLDMEHILDGDIKTSGLVTVFSAPCFVSSSVLSCFINYDNSPIQHVQNSSTRSAAGRQLLEIAPNMCDIQSLYRSKDNEVLDRGISKNLGFDGNTASVPSRFAVDEFGSPISNSSLEKLSMENNLNKVKEEPDLEILDTTRVGIPALPQFPPNELMGIFTE